MFVLVIFLAAALGYKDFEKRIKNSHSLITDIRRQLMLDNYDYSLESNNNNITEKNRTTTKIIDAVRKNFYITKPKEDNKSIRDISYDSDEKAKYRFLKAKHNYRRNNQARLIQEENKDGVAIVNLDGGPFPELQLSKNRRQYMHQRGELLAEEKEVPPPPVDASDPEAAAEDLDEKELNKREI